MKYKFPYDIIPVDPEVNSELLKYFHGERDGFVQVGPEKYFFPQKFQASAEELYNFEARPSDIWVVSFPRSGTTWTQEMVWLIANDCNFKKAREQFLSKRYSFFEFSNFMHPEVKKELICENINNLDNLAFIEEISQPGYRFLKSVTDRRFIKSHLPFSLLPPSVMKKKSKIVYVARNPKDVAVSFFYLNRLYKTQGYIGDFERYWKYFENGYNPWLPYWSHIKEGWEHRHQSNVLFLFYENMVKNLETTLTDIANFLDKKMSNEAMENLVNHLNVSKFKQNPSVNGQEMNEIGIYNMGEPGFVRNGRAVDGWQAEYNETLKLRAQKWIDENARRTGISFPE